MKTYLLFFVVLSFTTKIFSQTSGIIWQKALSHNFDTTQTGIILQGFTTDSSNCIYLCYSLNGSDTTSSIFSKYSPSGELLWRRTLLPNNEFDGIWTQFDYQARSSFSILSEGI